VFHFKPEVARADALRRMDEILKLEAGEIGERFPVLERRVTLPSPRVGHGALVAAIDEALAAAAPGLALTGNYFEGLAIEDCIQRAFAEWERIAAQ
jgi:protoporphyrinogen oxidase